MRAIPRSRQQGRGRILSGAVLLGSMGAASAYTVNLAPAAPVTVYLQVGVGSFSDYYVKDGVPGNNPTINVVSATVAAATLGSGTAQPMTTDSTAAQSYYDGFAFCNVPGQLYIGGFYRTTGGPPATATVSATVPAALTDAAGDRIPFSNIRWTASGNRTTGAEPFPAGTFVNGGVQMVGSMGRDSWNESCWTFSYVNGIVPPAGTFTGRVLYTLTSP